MQNIVRSLINEKAAPLTVKRTDTLQHALKLMMAHDFSQLPVIEDNLQPEGVINHSSILRALTVFKLGLDQLLVGHAMDTAYIGVSPDDYLTTLQDRLMTQYAVLVVDDDTGELLSIVTNYDTAVYFRSLAEDLMLVKEVEEKLREHSRAAFDYDESQLQIGIERVRNKRNDISDDKLLEAIQSYLRESGSTLSVVKGIALQKAFQVLRPPLKKEFKFEDLSFSEYMALLIDGGKWDLYQPTFGHLQQKAFRDLLKQVNDIRNTLAHFKRDLLPDEQNLLKWCADFFSRHGVPQSSTIGSGETGIQTSQNISEIPELVAPKALSGTNIEELTNSAKDQSDANTRVPPVEEELDQNTTKYSPLAEYLRAVPTQQESVMLKFEQIEEIIKSKLPITAKTTRAWWANDSVGHVQSKSWLDADWRVNGMSFSEQRVTFVRMVERERAYIRFYSKLLSNLKARAPFALPEQSSRGTNWHTILEIRDVQHRVVSSYSFSFAHRGRFRAELYISTGEVESTKAIYAQLEREREKIQAEIGELIAWEPLEHRTASRIALYHPGSITDGEGALQTLRDWAVVAMTQLYAALTPRLQAIINP